MITHFISLFHFRLCYLTSAEFKTSRSPSFSSSSPGCAAFPGLCPAGINTDILHESSANRKRRN